MAISAHTKKMSALIILIVFLLAGGFFAFSVVNNPKLDTSSEETIKISLEKMRASLSAKEKEKLGDSLQFLLFSELNLADVLSGKVKADSFVTDGLKKFDRKNAQEIIAAAEQGIKERKNEQKKQAQSEIQEIEEKIKTAKQSEDTLSKIEILKSKFYKDKNDYRIEPIIDLAVKNGTDHAISLIYFEGILASPNRSVPWVKDNFNYDIKGGLEPGETANWKLSPNMFSDWGRTEAPKDAILTVKVIRIDDAEGKELANMAGTSEENLERLEKLKQFVLED